MEAAELWGGDRFHDFAKRVFDYDLVYFSTVPICLTDARGSDGTTVLDRTGVLLDVGGFYFLITAAHGTSAKNTIFDIFCAGYRAFIPPMEYLKEGELYTELRWDNLWISSRPGTDFAVFELTVDTANGLKEMGNRFIGMGSVFNGNNRQSGQTLYLVSGYPTEAQVIEGEKYSCCKYYPWLTVPWNPRFGDPSTLPFEYDPNTHLLMHYPKNAIHTSGTRGQSPVPRGMSGGGAWYVRDFESPVIWNEDQVKLIALQSSWFDKARVLKALWIDEALAIIWHQRSDTRNAMRLHGFEF